VKVLITGALFVSPPPLNTSVTATVIPMMATIQTATMVQIAHWGNLPLPPLFFMLPKVSPSSSNIDATPVLL
jgi:hypothetical protein